MNRAKALLRRAGVTGARSFHSLRYTYALKSASEMPEAGPALCEGSRLYPSNARPASVVRLRSLAAMRTYRGMAFFEPRMSARVVLLRDKAEAKSPNRVPTRARLSSKAEMMCQRDHVDESPVHPSRPREQFVNFRGCHLPLRAYPDASAKFEPFIAADLIYIVTGMARCHTDGRKHIRERARRFALRNVVLRIGVD